MNQNKLTSGEKKELKLRKAYKKWARNHNKDTYWIRIREFRAFLKEKSIIL